MKIKVCGLKHPQDIDFVNETKPDYIGFVFAESKRQINPKEAKVLKSKLDKDIKTVGVFVDGNISFINSLFQDGIIDIAQLHGVENDEYISKILFPVIKAVRLGEEYNRPCDYILFDSHQGGSGKSFDWSKLPKVNQPFFLAGGINLTNINEAIKINPYCIDVSSGVETNGKKDKKKIIEIVKKVQNG